MSLYCCCVLLCAPWDHQIDAKVCYIVDIEIVGRLYVSLWVLCYLQTERKTNYTFVKYGISRFGVLFRAFIKAWHVFYIADIQMASLWYVSSSAPCYLLDGWMTSSNYDKKKMFYFVCLLYTIIHYYTLLYIIIHYYTLLYVIIHYYSILTGRKLSNLYTYYTLLYTIIHYYTLLYTIIHYYSLLFTIIHYYTLLYTII